MGQNHKRFRESRTPFPLRDIRKNPRSMNARVLQAMAQFVLKIEKLSHIMGPTPILEMARAYGLCPRLWLLAELTKILSPSATGPIKIERRFDDSTSSLSSSKYVTELTDCIYSSSVCENM